MKRIVVVLLTVVVLMMAVMATSIAPAFAAGGWVATLNRDPQTSENVYIYCRAGDQAVFAFAGPQYAAADRNANRWVCDPSGSDDRPYDDKTAFAGGWVANRKTDPITGNTENIYCRTGDQPLYTVGEGQDIVAADRNANRWVCISNGNKARPYDDRSF
jgi:type II secretory pathway pseudopilin PulG